MATAMDKTAATKQIGENFAEFNYDVIHVQEDFNYHATLYKYDIHPYRTATSGGVPFGSGLNTLSNYPWTSFQRIKWATCSQASENDCLTPKGFTFMRARIADGVSIDFINLDANAGIEAGDETARNANLQQVAAFVERASVGNAVVIFRDTNSRYTRAADIAIRTFTTTPTLNFIDAWVLLTQPSATPSAPGSTDLLCTYPVPASTACEVVDKVLFRGSQRIGLTATDFVYDADRFLDEPGGALSDRISGEG